jgi:hypothetical protein
LGRTRVAASRHGRTSDLSRGKTGTGKNTNSFSLDATAPSPSNATPPAGAPDAGEPGKSATPQSLPQD